MKTQTEIAILDSMSPEALAGSFLVLSTHGKEATAVRRARKVDGAVVIHEARNSLTDARWLVAVKD